MCTETHDIRKVSPDARFAILARMGEAVFHARDAAVLWNIPDANTLHTTLSRYVRAGLLFRLHNGLYSIKPPHELAPFLIGAKAIHGPCYVTTETVLARAGIIQQHVACITFASSVSRQFSLLGHRFRSRQLAPEHLLCEQGIVRQGDVRVATPERAVADMLYFDPRYHFDAAAHIDWDAVRRVQEATGYAIIRRTGCV